jgi:hypothetical protein
VKKTIMMLLLLALVALTTACAQEDMKAKNIFEKSITAMNEVKSMSMTMDMHAKYEGAEEPPIVMDTQVSADVVLDPLAMYQKMNMKQESSAQSIDMEMYLSTEGIFLFDTQAQQWMKFPEEMRQQMLQMSQVSTDPAAQLEQLQGFVDDFTFTEENDAYILTLASNDVKFKDLIKQQLGNGALGDAEMAEVLWKTLMV